MGTHMLPDSDGANVLRFGICDRSNTRLLSLTVIQCIVWGT
jgi:hypothetical protein